MDANQKYYLDKYTQDLNVAYNNLHDSRVDYDTFKPIADSSINKTTNAKKVFDNLSPTYIYYPDFLKSLQLLYLNAKAQSDDDQNVLKQKADLLASNQKIYDGIVGKINALEVQIYEEELAADIQNLVNVPENMVQSDELVIAKAAADKAAAEKAAADKAITDALKVNSKTGENTIIKDPEGREVCLDPMGNEIDMGICRPTSASGGGGGVGGASREKTPSELVAENINSWLQQYQPKVNAPNGLVTPSTPKSPDETPSVNKVLTPEEQATKDAKADADKAAAANKEAADKAAADKAAADKAPNATPEDYINSFVFNVDLSQLNTEKTTTTNTKTETSTENATQSAQTDVENQVTNNTISNTPIVPDSTKNSRMVFGAAALAVIVAYNLIKKKD